MKRSSFLVFTVAVSLAFSAGSVRAGGEGSAQANPARTNQTQELSVARIYGAQSLSGNLTTGLEWSPDAKRISYLERNPRGNNGATELWTLDATTGERKVLVNSETLKAVTQAQKTSATQRAIFGLPQAVPCFSPAAVTSCCWT
jgi:hypothetical protein